MRRRSWTTTRSRSSSIGWKGRGEARQLASPHSPDQRTAPGMMRSGEGPTEQPTSEPFLPAARRSFGVEAVRLVSQTELMTLPWAALTAFSHPGVPQRQILVVAPLSGGFPFLLRDLVVGLLRHAHQVAVTDWPDARFVSLAHGQFGVSDSISHVISMIRTLGPDLHVVAVSQGAVTALAAVALLAAEDR